MVAREFRVVTHRRWVTERFSSLGGVQDYGFPADRGTADPDAVYWAPGAWVAGVAAAGVRLPLVSCGPRWLDRLPAKYRGRSVNTAPLREWHTRRLAGRVFVKLPEAKREDFLAQVVDAEHLGEHLAQAPLAPDALVQVQGVREFHTEARFWVAHGSITAESLYRVGERWWGDDDFAADTETVAAQRCLRELRDVAGQVVADVDCPPGFTIDVGQTVDGDVLVVEANAAWSSGLYDGDPDGIFAAIEAAHDFDGVHPQWAWAGVCGDRTESVAELAQRLA